MSKINVHILTTALSTQEQTRICHVFNIFCQVLTFLVLDNAKVHRSKLMMKMRAVWENRGLFLFFLPPYCPQLNIAETIWRMLKGKWIQASDYASEDSLFYAADRALSALGTAFKIHDSLSA